MKEFKRINNYKFIIIFFLLLCLNGITLLYFNKGEDAVNRIYDDILNRAEAAKTEDMTYKQATMNGVISYMDDNSIDRETISEIEKTARKMALEKAEQADSYADNINEKITSTTKLLSTELMKDNSTEKYLLLKSRYDLNKLKNKNPGLSNGIWLEKLFEYNYIQIFIITLICYVVYGFFYEKKSGLKLIINSGKNGRKNLRTKRIIILIIECFFISFSFYLESMIILLGIHGGVKGINDLAVLDNNLLLTTMGFTRICFVLFLIVISALFAFVCGMMLWFLLSYFSNINIGVGFFLICSGIDIMIYYLINSKSILRFLHFINVYYILFPHYAIEYDNWGYGTLVGKGLNIFTGFLMIVAFVLSGITVLSNKLEYTHSNNFIEKTADFIHEKNMKLLTKMPNNFKELYKILISQKNIIALVVLFIIVLNINIGTRHIYSIEESYMLSYYQNAEGLMYGDRLNDVKNTVEADILQAVGQDNELTRFISDNMNANIKYLKAQKENGYKAVCIAPYEYEDAFGSKQKENHMFLALINMFAVIFISSPFGAYENKNGMDKLINPAKNRGKWLICKLKTNSVIIAVFMLLSYGVYYYKLCNTYEISNIFLTIKSLELFDTIPINLPLIVWLIINMICVYVGLMIISCLITIIMYKLQYSLCTLTGIIITIPQLIYMAGIDFMEKFSIGKYIAVMPLINENKGQIYCYFIFTLYSCLMLFYGIFLKKRYIKV